MRQLFWGLKYCHDNHVLHRDLKPSDLLVNNHGVLKIAGFGSASFFELIHEQPMTNRVATDWCMAPELRLGVTEYGVGVDLWSAGCILAGLFAKEADQLQKIHTLCGSHSDEYCKTYKLPLETLNKPQLQSKRCLTETFKETFKDFPPSSLSLLDVLLSVDPAKRPSAASALESKFLSEVSQEDESQTTEMEYKYFITTNTTSTRLAKQKDDIKRSAVWNHFTEFLDNDGKKKSRCNYCASTFGTSMLTVHMKSCASNHSNQFQTRSSLTIATTKVEDSGKTKVGLHAWRFDQQVAKKSIIEMLIRDKLPFKFVENEGFRRCMEQCQPALVIPSTSTLKRDLYELFLDEKEKLKSQLSQSTLKVCLTIDTWTSLQRANYLCLTAHFIDNNWRLQKKVINFCRILSLKGSDIGRIVYLCLVDWGLENIFTITIDNASSDDTAIQYMRRKCKWNLCVLKSKWTHVRCITCVVNLVVQDIIGKMDGSVDKVRAAVRYVTRSPTTLKKFKEFAKLENAECQKTLCLDVPNRWSSTYLMLSVAIIYQQSFDKLAIYEDFMYNNDLGDQHWVPSSFDWDNVKRLVGFLQHCYKFTLEVSGTRYTTSNNFLDYVCCIHSVLKECFSSEDHVLREMSSRMKRKLDEYWGDIDKFNLLVFIASMFDPRKKFMYLEVSLCNIYGDEDGRKTSALCKNALYELFNDYIGIYSDIELELDRYLTEDIEEDNEDFIVLDWWKRRSTTFPILSLVACDVLAIPISTVSCESCLPTKGKVLKSIGASLTPETIQSLICYQDWIRSSDVPVNVEEHIRELDNFADGMRETVNESTLYDI